jgi:hypothetical protein
MVLDTMQCRSVKNKYVGNWCLDVGINTCSKGVIEMTPQM